ncbi:hypothetical protein L3X38_016165 [Prunus dulcis]|uniref:PB1-like domain-containing protein n=1 Tax=Prunus dulcis TaxID=3755 RepID=A0AAD4W5E7_PRUDU|nr:hypothetical protein L3X38_016165 [Prunus dulcis]
MKIRDGKEAPIDTNPDMFPLEVHHRGYFVDGLYMGGIVQWVNRQDADEVSMLELFELVKHLGYDEQNIQYYYKHRTNGWVEIRTYKDYFGALKLVKPSQLFVFYITDNPAPKLLNVQSRCARRLRFVKNDPNRVRLVCDGNKEDKLEDCPWLLYVAHVGKGPTIRVKTYHPIHTCGRSQRTRFATSQWLAKRFDEDLRTNPNMSIAQFMTLVRKHYSINVTRD